MVGLTLRFCSKYFSTSSNTVISPPDREIPFAKSRSSNFSFSLSDKSGFFPSGILSCLSNFQLYTNFLFLVIGSIVLNKYLPSARCCSPIRNIRFLLSLLFSLMVYPPNYNTIPTIGMGIVSELHIFCKVFFAFI